MNIQKHAIDQICPIGCNLFIPFLSSIHISILLPVLPCQDYYSLKVLKSGNMSPPTLFFSEIISGYFSFLAFPYTFQNQLDDFYKESSQVLVGITLNLQSNLGRIDILTTLRELNIFPLFIQVFDLFNQSFSFLHIDFAHTILDLYLSISGFLVKAVFFKCRLCYFVSLFKTLWWVPTALRKLYTLKGYKRPHVIWTLLSFSA